MEQITKSGVFHPLCTVRFCNFKISGGWISWISCSAP